MIDSHHGAKCNHKDRLKSLSRSRFFTNKQKNWNSPANLHKLCYDDFCIAVVSNSGQCCLLGAVTSSWCWACLAIFQDFRQLKLGCCNAAPSGPDNEILSCKHTPRAHPLAYCLFISSPSYFRDRHSDYNFYPDIYHSPLHV